MRKKYFHSSTDYHKKAKNCQCFFCKVRYNDACHSIKVELEKAQLVRCGQVQVPKTEGKLFSSGQPSKTLKRPQLKAKTSVDLFSLPIKKSVSGQEKQADRKALRKKGSLQQDGASEKKPLRNQAGFSNFSNLKARSRRKRKQEPGPFRITMKKLQSLEISKSQTKAIGREEVKKTKFKTLSTKFCQNQFDHA